MSPTRHAGYEATIAVAPGDGLLIRRALSCLFLPPPCGQQAASLVEHVLESDTPLHVVLGDYVLAHDDAPPFVLVAWPAADSDDAILVLVRGNAEVDTDLASIPSLSGAGSPTWVEHRVPRRPDAATIRSGGAPAAGTSLHAGVVPAGGFSLELRLQQDTAPGTGDPTPTPAAAPAPAPPIDDEAESDAQRAAPTGLAALREATGIEDSTPDTKRSVADTATPAATPTRAVQAPLPAETTAEPARRAAPAFPNPPSAGAPPSAPAATASTDTAHRSPVRFPGDDPADVNGDPEVTLEPGDIGNRPSAPPPRLIRAHLCSNGHQNPPHLATCRVCRDELGDHDMVTVEQPVLATAELPSGDSISIDTTIVLGRNPSDGAARVDGPHRLVVLDAPASVSRTHAVISAEGWTITATDCGSQGGSALVPAGSGEPIELVPWVPHELSGGDVLYLGGPTPVRINDVPG